MTGSVGTTALIALQSRLDSAQVRTICWSWLRMTQRFRLTRCTTLYCRREDVAQKMRPQTSW